MSTYENLTSLLASGEWEAPKHLGNSAVPYASSFHTYFSHFEIAYRQDKNQGFRDYMEDGVQVIEDFTPQFPLFIGVYDGHGGSFVSEYCLRYFAGELTRTLQECSSPEAALILAFERVDFALLKAKAMSVGATATVCIVSNQNLIYTANVGDSEAVLLSSVEVVPLTEVHRCENPAERERLLASGAKIIRERVHGRLMLTRALGDHELKDKGVLWNPYVSCRQFTSAFSLIVASDGLWDSVKAKELTLGENAKETARLVFERAFAKKSRDNITVAVVSWLGNN